MPKSPRHPGNAFRRWALSLRVGMLMSGCVGLVSANAMKIAPDSKADDTERAAIAAAAADLEA